MNKTTKIILFIGAIFVVIGAWVWFLHPLIFS